MAVAVKQRLIDNFYLTTEELAASPSRQCGVSEADEGQLRVFGCELIQQAGVLLRLPQAVLATGQALLHRFYCKESFTNFNVKAVAMACIFLSTKLEENARNPREIISVFHRMERRREGKSPDVLDLGGRRYEEMKGEMIRIERHMLRAFGFILHVEHPHKYVLNYAQLLLSADTAFLQEAWNLTNDSLRTTLCIRFKGETVACGVIYMAARRLRVALPEHPPWWEVYSVRKEDMIEVCRTIAALYDMPKAAPMALGKGLQPSPARPALSRGSADTSSMLAARSPGPPNAAVTTPHDQHVSNGESTQEAGTRRERKDDASTSRLPDSAAGRDGAGPAAGSKPSSSAAADKRERRREREAGSSRHRRADADSRKRKGDDRSRDRRDGRSHSHKSRGRDAEGHHRKAKSEGGSQHHADTAEAGSHEREQKRQKEGTGASTGSQPCEEGQTDLGPRSPEPQT